VLHDGFNATSPATGHFAMAIRSRPLRRRRIGSVSISAIHAIRARPIETYGLVAGLPPARTLTTCSLISRGLSVSSSVVRALRVPGNRLRFASPPDSGGSFGVKQGIFPYIVLIAAAARAVGRPVKMDRGSRLEHLTCLGFRHQPGHDAARSRS